MNQIESQSSFCSGELPPLPKELILAMREYRWAAPRSEASDARDKLEAAIQDYARAAFAAAPVGSGWRGLEPARCKTSSYEADGVVVARFTNRAGAERVVFEFDEPTGMLHIFNPSQVTPLDREDVPPSAALATKPGSDAQDGRG